MPKAIDRVKEMTAGERSRFSALSRKVVLATVGAVGIAQDEIDGYVKRLVERGELSEKQARKLMVETKEKRAKAAKHAEQTFEHRIEKVLHRANVPTRRDVEALSAKITTLTHRVEQLNNHDGKAHHDVKA
jgi:poly(hydroxyalkanoate) granule-associated protein